MTRILAAIAALLLALAMTRLSLPAVLIAAASVTSGCLVLAWLIATGLGRLVESGPRYRTAPDWSTA
jgi:hypothetical protein